MEISIISQLLMVVESVFLGIFLGLIYDGVIFLRILFGIIPSSKLTLKLKEKRFLRVSNPYEGVTRGKKTQSVIFFFTDLLYFVIVSLIMAIFIYYVNDGIVRWFIFAGLILGMIVYRFTVGKIIGLFLEHFAFYLRILFKYGKFFIGKLFIPILKKFVKIKLIFEKIPKRKKKKNIEERKSSVLFVVGKIEK